jgi:hypothetical protein
MTMQAGIQQSGQTTFNPIHFGFHWTDDGSWYEWDRDAAHKAAQRERNLAAKCLRQAGRKVRCFNTPNQLMSKGGIGSGKTHVEFVVTVYGLEWTIS